MAMGNSLIFVSCGQFTDAEKTLGVLIKAVIDGTPGFEAYFAETVQDMEALGRHVLDGLQRCAGAIVILQDRGIVTQSDGAEWGHRSSVWVNQEVAILAYRQFYEAKKIPILAFADTKVRLEGAMTSLIVNPRPLAPAADIVTSVKSWLVETQFGAASDEAFMTKWNELSESGKMFVVGLLREGGRNVKQHSVRRTVTTMFGIDIEVASKLLREAKLEFQNTDLIKLIKDINTGDEFSVHPTWEFQLRRQAAQWLAKQKA